MSDLSPSMFRRFGDGWAMRRLKYLATLNDEVLPENTDPSMEIEYIEIADVSLTGGVERNAVMEFDEAPSRARRRVRGGDVLVSTVRTYLKAIAAVPKASENLVASTGFCVVRPGSDVEPRYMGWVAKSEPFVSEIVSRSVGVSYPAIKPSEVGSLAVPLPDRKTQERIADYLDERTARIDGLIARKERLLELLAEKRQALITRAVTKGLDPDAPMKPSGIGWLGDIPAHWDVKRLRFLTKMASGATPPTAEPSYWDGGIPWVCPKDMKTDHVSTSLVTVSQVAIDKHGLRRFNEPHVVIVTRGMILARRVPVAVASGGFTINQDMRVLTTQGRVIPSYLQMYLSAIGNYLLTLVGEAGHGTKALRTDVLMDTPVLVPPLEEQKILTAEVKKAAQGHEGTTANIGRSIGTLKEYRSALITAAVTGQLDVTEEAA